MFPLEWSYTNRDEPILTEIPAAPLTYEERIRRNMERHPGEYNNPNHAESRFREFIVDTKLPIMVYPMRWMFVSHCSPAHVRAGFQLTLRDHAGHEFITGVMASSMSGRHKVHRVGGTITNSYRTDGSTWWNTLQRYFSQVQVYLHAWLLPPLARIVIDYAWPCSQTHLTTYCENPLVSFHAWKEREDGCDRT